MAELHVTTRTGANTAIDAPTVEALQSAMRGELLRSGDTGYHDARAVWNCMIDRRPGLIARCAGVADVIQAVNFARAHNLLVSVRGGGHNLSGIAVCNGGLVIDLTLMKSVRVDAKQRTARAEGGVTWGEFDRETQAFGLATVGGTVTTTGIAGLTLGGGIGWLTRQHGLTCDNLLSVDLVTAAGACLTVSAVDHADLFWGLRGGGGNFGVVTSFEYQLHPVGPMLGGLVVYPQEKAVEFLRFYREFSQNLPEQANTIGGLLTSPDGASVVAIAVSYNGPIDTGEAAFRPLRDFGSPLLDDIRPRTYIEMQELLGDMFPEGRRSYMKSNFITNISDEAIDTLVSHSTPLPSPLSFVAFQQLGGAASRVGKNATAFSHREAQYDLLFNGIGLNPAEDAANRQWARKVWEAMQPFVDRGVYLNNIGQEDEEPEGIKDAWNTATHERLVALKNTYDPTNMFCHNQNIKPTV